VLTRTTPARHPLVGQVQELVNGVHRLAHDAGRRDIAAQLESEAQRYRSPETTVVVVGQAKRGKSALVNALLDAPGLLPVDADVATSIRLVVTAGEAGASVTRETDAGEVETIEVPLGELAAWATERGNPGNERRVHTVSVRHSHQLLAGGLVLIDTPGVGGLESGHTEVTLATLAVADALLFVIDPSSPITAPELAFLERATHRIDTVIVVLTKTDAFRGWPDILDDDRALIARHAPRFAAAPIVPVSSRMAEVALRAEIEGREGLAARARTDSRISDLVDELDRRVLHRNAGVRLANLLRVGERALATVEEAERTRVEASQGGSRLADELEVEQARLRTVTERSSRWRVELDVALRQLGLDFDTELEWAITTLDRSYEQRIGRASPEELAALDEELATTLGALWVNINLYLRDRLLGISAELIANLELEGIELEPTDLAMPDRLGELLEQARAAVPAEDAAARLMNYYPAIFAGSGVSMAAGFLAPMGVSIGAGPLVLLSGAAVAGMLALRRSASRKSRSVREATKLVKAALPHARSTIAKQFARQLIDVRRGIEDQVGRSLEERRRQIEATVREQQQVLRQDLAQRQQVQAEAEARLVRLDALRTQARALLAELAPSVRTELPRDHAHLS
jgi:signal recognition particle receptor subunit beta